MTCKKSIASSALLVLALATQTGCSTITDRSTQIMRIETPGAEQALCELRRPGYRSRDFTPTTIRITKSKGPLTITCVAAGNREKAVVVEPKLEQSYYYNALNLGIGSAYDYETGAMWKYPDKIVIDFTDVPPQPMPLPEYQRMLTAHPEIGGMETFRPGVAALPGDRGETIQELQPRPPGQENDLGGAGMDDENEEMIDSGTAVKHGAKGDASSVPPPPAPTSIGAAPAAPVPIAAPPVTIAPPVAAIPTPIPAAPPSAPVAAPDATSVPSEGGLAPPPASP